MNKVTNKMARQNSMTKFKTKRCVDQRNHRKAKMVHFRFEPGQQEMKEAKAEFKTFSYGGPTIVS